MEGGSRWWADRDGPVAYREWPGPPPVTFVGLHAVGGSSLHWRGVAPRLADHGGVVALDLIGFGRTPRRVRSAGLDADQAMLGRFLRAQTAAAVVLVGHSMGAGVALLQATREPRSVGALVLTSPLLAPSREGSSDGAALAAFLARRLRMRTRALGRSLSRRPTIEGIVDASVRGGAADPGRIDPELIRESVGMAHAAGPRETGGAYAQAARSTFGLVSRPARFRALLDRVECPVLLLHGGRDRTIPLPFAERVARDHPAWRLEVFPDLGHMLQIEDPEAWSEVVGRWLSQALDPPP